MCGITMLAPNISLASTSPSETPPTNNSYHHHLSRISLMPHITLLFFLVSLYILISCLYSLLWIPWRTHLHFRRQGIHGPPCRLIFGNTGEIKDMITAALSKPTPLRGPGFVQRIIPHYHHWSAEYGKTFLFWFGSTPRLAIGDPTVVREVTLNSEGAIEKIPHSPATKQLLGEEGIVGLKGRKWAMHRKVAAPAFSMERVKGWVPEIAVTTMEMLQRWEKVAGDQREFEMEVNKEFHDFTADVISRVAFGSSFEEGRRVFDLQQELAEDVSLTFLSVDIPGFRFIPTKRNWRMRKLSWEIQDSLRKLVHAKIKARDSEDSQNNLLGMMLSSNRNEGKGERLSIEAIIDECMTFYFAGKDTSADLLSWVVLHLALHQDWQDKAREEVLNTCGDHEFPTTEDVANLKIMGMILNETLRVYPPVVSMLRVASKDTKLGGIAIPAGTQVFLPLAAINRDKELWGPDAEHFNPQRFANGKKPSIPFLPFGYGPRICIAQNLALVEAKVALAMIIRRYSFTLSPTYVHAPMPLISLKPQHGIQIVLQRL